jgi:multidrug resistance efflux pump
VSPADGYVVVRDPATGAYGIGSNDSSLRVVAQVPEQYLFGLRAGQKAQVSVDLLPEVILSATIRSIDEVPVESATGHLYTVTFTVANPRGLSFDAEPVHIRIAGSAQ